MITAGTLITYQYAVHTGFSESLTRTMVFTVLIAANVSLTLVNRSFYYSVITTMRYKNNLVILIPQHYDCCNSIIAFFKPAHKILSIRTFEFISNIHLYRNRLLICYPV